MYHSDLQIDGLSALATSSRELDAGSRLGPSVEPYGVSAAAAGGFNCDRLGPYVEPNGVIAAAAGGFNCDRLGPYAEPYGVIVALRG